MRDDAVQLKATAKGEDPPITKTGVHYAVQLLPQDELQFVVSPERAARSAAPRGAILRFQTEKGGRYRIALTSSHWIDLVVDGRVVASVDHQGRAGCKYLHKIVEFDLPAKRDVILQLSGQDDSMIQLAITAPAG